MNFWLYILCIALFASTTTILAIRNRPTSAILTGGSTVLFSRYIEIAGASPVYWHDSFFYIIVAKGIKTIGSTTIPASTIPWYGTAELAKWPMLQVLTVALSHATGLSLQTLKALFPPILACILFIGACYWLGNLVSYRVAIPTALLLVFLDPFFRYLTQYHAQGAGAVYFLFLAAGLSFHYRRRSLSSLIFVVLAAFALAPVHRFTSAFTILTLGLYYLLEHARKYLSGAKEPIPAVVVATILVLFSYHVLLAPGFLIFGLQTVFGGSVTSATGGAGSLAGGSIIAWFGLFLKLLLSVIAVPAIYLTLKGRTGLEPELSLLVSVAVIGVPMGLGAGATMARIVLLGYIVLIPFVALSFARVDRMSMGPVSGSQLMVGGVVCILMVGVLGGVVPSFVDSEVDVSADGFSGIEPVSEQEVVAAGSFVSEYNRGPLYVSFWTRIPATYYGGQDLGSVDYPAVSPAGNGFYDAARTGRVTNDSVVYRSGRFLIRLCDPGSTHCAKGRLEP